MTISAAIDRTGARHTALPRPRLLTRLDEAARQRLVCVVAGPGFGKSTLLDVWARDRLTAWHVITPVDRDLGSFASRLAHALSGPGFEARFPLGDGVWRTRGPGPDDAARAFALAGQLCEAIPADGRSRTIIFDDVETLSPGTPAAALVEALCREVPAHVCVVLSGRQDPPFRVARLRAYGYLAEVTAEELAFTGDEVGELLAGVAGPQAAAEAPAVLDATGGWPVAVRLVAEASRGASAVDVHRLLTSTSRVEGPLFDLLAHEVFAREPAAVRELFRLTASLGQVVPAMCTQLAGADSAAAIADLARRGLFVEARPPGSGRFSLIPLAREYVLRHHPLPEPQRISAHRRAAQWYASHDDPAGCIDALLAIDDRDGVAAMLLRRGDEILASGAVNVVSRALEAIPATARDEILWRLAGEVAQVTGDWDGALACFTHAAGTGPLRAGMAWRLGLINYLRGEPAAASAVFERSVSGLDEPREEAQLAAWSAAARWAAGDLDGCRALAGRALEQARLARDARALAAAHGAWCLVSVLAGDRGANDDHYHLALVHAERAADALQLVRLRTNRASHLMEEGEYQAALSELAQAIPLARACGFVTFHALALHNRGDTYRCLGRLTEAVADLSEARRLYQRVGSRHVCRPLRALGDVYRARGDRNLARAAYEEAIRAAQECGEPRSVALSLAGLALSELAHDLDTAKESARRALDGARGPTRIAAILAHGWVRAADGDRASAAQRAGEAAEAARLHRDRAALAAALELMAEVADGPAARAHLLEAGQVWHEIGDPLGVARVDLALARVLGATEGQQPLQRAELAAKQLGAHGLSAMAGKLREEFTAQRRPEVSIHTLGGFQVLHRGNPLPAAQWQSRKARDLVKMLVARRGRPVPRTSLMDALWPGEDPARLANRMSVALSTARAVLDPAKSFPPHHLLVAHDGGVRLDVAGLTIDVMLFLTEASRGLALRRDGDPAWEEWLGKAHSRYAGDFLEGEADDGDWAEPLRTEARLVYLQVSRALAEGALECGQTETAVRHLLSILERDAYDERAHLALVQALERAGDHGEARRRYRDYATRMSELDAEPAPFPAPHRDPGQLLPQIT